MTETSEGSEKSELEEKVSEETSKSEMPPPSTCKVLKSTKSRLVPKYPCTGCGKPFNRLMKLKYHIRSAHFNLKSVVPTLETKHVNDIWYESVINTNDVVEMRKESDTKIIIKKCITNEPISTILTQYVVSFATENYDVDVFIERMLASKKFSELADIIAEKTILKLRDVKNDTLPNPTLTNSNGEAERKLRRDSDLKESEHPTSLHASLKYKHLLKQFSNKGQNESSLSKENNSDDSIESFNIYIDNTTMQYLNEIEQNVSGLASHEKSIQKNTDRKVTVDVFDFNRQNDLHRKKTGRMEGGKIFVFQSSSEYDEYHENVDGILRNETSV
ncbi:unnamed protein product [Leptosia nina]|uniref:C2H2-type domain-containing protein n=1 Tax=Leptosia nina TaxID=320188 RepID=A0AAV1JXP8_9NEOP